MIAADPLAGIKLPKMRKTSGFHTWTLEEIAQYRTRHLPGTKPRLALELILQTGHARADVVRMGRQHIKAGKLSMRRQKTKVQFDIPLLPDLVAELERHPKTDQLTFLTTGYGEPFTAAGFGNWFGDRCIEAGVPGRAHGLRKASCIERRDCARIDGVVRLEDDRRGATLSRKRTESGSPKARPQRSFHEQELANRKTSLPKIRVSH